MYLSRLSAILIDLCSYLMSDSVLERSAAGATTREMGDTLTFSSGGVDIRSLISTLAIVQTSISRLNILEDKYDHSKVFGVFRTIHFLDIYIKTILNIKDYSYCLLSLLTSRKFNIFGLTGKVASSCVR
jgi:hypothetical protein